MHSLGRLRSQGAAARGAGCGAGHGGHAAGGGAAPDGAGPAGNAAGAWAGEGCNNNTTCHGTVSCCSQACLYVVYNAAECSIPCVRAHDAPRPPPALNTHCQVEQLTAELARVRQESAKTLQVRCARANGWMAVLGAYLLPVRGGGADAMLPACFLQLLACTRWATCCPLPCLQGLLLAPYHGFRPSICECVCACMWWDGTAGAGGGPGCGAQAAGGGRLRARQAAGGPPGSCGHRRPQPGDQGTRTPTLVGSRCPADLTLAPCLLSTRPTPRASGPHQQTALHSGPKPNGNNPLCATGGLLNGMAYPFPLPCLDHRASRNGCTPPARSAPCSPRSWRWVEQKACMSTMWHDRDKGLPVLQRGHRPRGPCVQRWWACALVGVHGQRAGGRVGARASGGDALLVRGT